jgi:hypothetical protein
MWSQQIGDTATFSFEGDDVSWYLAKAWWGGAADITIDGIFRENFDLAGGPEIYMPARVFSGLGGGRHTITITVTNNGWVGIEGFEVALNPLAGGGFNLGYHWAYWPAPGAGQGAAFNFAGSEITYHFMTGPDRGIVHVLIDGAFYEEVDLYSPSSAGDARFYPLAAGKHVIHIVIVGQNPASTGVGHEVIGFSVQ